MSSAQFVLALDAGQTGIRTLLRQGGRTVEQREFPGVLTDRPVLPQLADVAARALAPAGTAAALLAVGSSGLTDDMRAEDLLTLTRGAGIREVRLAHDSITSYLGALGDVTGAVVAAGTGVVTLAVGDADVARVDGWGYLLGDAGSGFWIGRAGLDAVLRAHDGRGPATALTPLAVAAFGDLEGAYMVVQADEHKVSHVAAWSRTVAELADRDPVCRDICQRAGAELATSVVAGLRRVGQGERPDPAVSTVGKVFGSRHVREAFQRTVAAQFPQVRLLPARGTGLDGAALLAEVAPDSSLFPRIRRATEVDPCR